MNARLESTKKQSSQKQRKAVLWTKEVCIEVAKKYPTRASFQHGCQSAYQKAYHKGWLEEVCAHMKPVYRPFGFWTKEECRKEAQKYSNRYAFQQACPMAYNKAYQKNWLDEICTHMVAKCHSRAYWTKDRCQTEALKYQSRSEFAKGCCSAYNSASVQMWLDEICAHMVPGRKKPIYWTKPRCQLEALKYQNRHDFRSNSQGAYYKAKREGWLDEICAYMKRKERKNKEENMKDCKIKKAVIYPVPYDCWNCGTTHIIYFVRGFLDGEGNNCDVADGQIIDPQVIHRKVQEYYSKLHPEFGYQVGEYKLRFSKTRGEEYMSFGCPKCDSIVGQFYVDDIWANVIYDEDPSHTFTIELD